VTACLVCGASENRSSRLPPTRFDGILFRYLQCVPCGSLFIAPLPSAETLGKMYEAGYHGAAGLEQSNRSHDDELDLLAAHLPPPARVLDFGCGTGTLVGAARGRGYLADGVEFSAAYVEELRRKYPTARFFDAERLEELDDGSYDAIVLSNVLEHLRDPRATMSRLIRLVAPGGVVYAFGPVEHNLSVVRLAILLTQRAKAVVRPTYVATDPPLHLTCTTARSQRAFFAKFGLREMTFKIVDEVWPYPRTLGELPGAAGATKWAIGRFSRMLSARVALMGNTFFYVGRTPDRRQS
jgi:SAM-dependent methyltransferase